ncbi:MAG TPA: TIGR02281 family clan AA aspartic protease [Pseudolabrys sp.]|nr:TIGR02281 family clan AA aspartic protease [Pseudolabrys sp.]
MRQILYFAIIALAVGGFAARYADKLMGMPKPAATMHAQAMTTQAPTSSRELVIPRDDRGHFQVDGRANGRPITFMVDTGATVIAMRESDAARLGIRPLPREYTANVSTANGNLKAAPVRFDSVEVGVGIRVFDVAGIVLPDEALSENLLGLSFLSKLRRFEYANGRLVLEQ